MKDFLNNFGIELEYVLTGFLGGLITLLTNDNKMNFVKGFGTLLAAVCFAVWLTPAVEAPETILGISIEAKRFHAGLAVIIGTMSTTLIKFFINLPSKISIKWKP